MLANRGEGGELTDEVIATLLELGLTQEQIDMLSGMQRMFFGGDVQGGGFPVPGGQAPADGGNAAAPRQATPQDGVVDVWQRAAQPVGSTAQRDGSAAQRPGSVTGYIILGVALLVLLAGAIVFVAWPK